MENVFIVELLKNAKPSQEALLEIVNASTNKEVALKKLLGFKTKFSKQELLEMKDQNIQCVAGEDITYDEWGDYVNYTTFVKLEVYVEKHVENPTVEDAVCLESGWSNESFPNIPTKNGINLEELKRVTIVTDKTKKTNYRLDHWCGK